MKRRAGTLRKILLACMCGIVALSALRADLGHLPGLLNVLNEHAEMVIDHGHSHGLEADMFSALQGHAHGLGDHEHVPDLLLALIAGHAPLMFGVFRTARLPMASPPPIFPFERPPRV